MAEILITDRPIAPETAPINIRPAQGNRSMEIQDPADREKVREIAYPILAGGGGS